MHQAIVLRMKKEEHFKRIDKMKSDTELIYKQQLNYFMNLCKLMSSVSLCGMTSLCVYKSLLAKNIIDEHFDAFGELVAETADVYPFMIGFYVFNIAILGCINLLPLRIYRHGSQYVAIFPGHLPIYNTKLCFKPGELVENFHSKISLNGVSYKLKNRNVILFEHRFRRPSDLYSILPKSQFTQYSK